MNISGLNIGQAVNFGQGMIVNCPRNTYLNGVEVVGQTFVADGDTLQTKHTTPGKILHYEWGDQTISVEEWQKLWRDLGEKYEKYTDEDGDYWFPTDDVRGHYLIDSADVYKWQAVKSEPVVEYTLFEPEIIGSVVDTGSDFIKQLIRYGVMKHDGRGVYKVECGAIARDEVAKHKDVMEVDMPTHSNIEYVKVNGKFMFTNSSQPFVKNDKNCYYTDDLQDAMNKEQDVRDFVRTTIAAKTDTRPFSMADGYEKLESVLNKLRLLDVKKKSEPDLRVTMVVVKELMEKLEDK